MSPVNGISGISGVSGSSGVSGVEYAPTVPGSNKSKGEGDAVTPVGGENVEETNQKKRLGIVECETCANRTYQDGSDDPGVSFKAPTKLNPTEAASAVPSHEREHFSREAASAKQNDREVISNSIRIFTSVCPECGRTYVAGGVTVTVTKGESRDEFEDIEALFGTGKNDKKDPNSVFNVNLKIANKAYGLNYDEKK